MNKNRIGAVVCTAALALLLAACTASATGSNASGSSPIDEDQIARSGTDPGDEAWPKGAGGAPTAQADAPTAAAGEPEPGRRVTTVEDCQQLARGPWADAEHGPDPIGRVRDGVVPSLPDGSDSPPDHVTEFPDLISYRDPSTLEDPGMVYDAMAAAGFQKGIEARWGEGHAYTAITVIQFEDAAGAKDALTAHLTDLCRRATSATVRDGGNGLLLTRDSEAVRSVFVMGDIEVSVFTCSCYWPDLPSRTDGITGWAWGVEAKLFEPGQDTGSA